MLIFRRTIVLVQYLISSLSLVDCSVNRLPEDCSPVQYTGYQRTAVLFSTQVTRGLQSCSVHRLPEDCSPVQYTGYQRTAVLVSKQVTRGLQSWSVNRLPEDCSPGQ